jgi:hypothetical protein
MGQVQRRQIVIAVGAILATPFVRAQKPPVLRLGLLWLGSPETTSLRTLCSTAYAAKATVKGAPSPSTTEAPLATTKSSSKLPPIWCSRRWWSAGGMCPGSVTVRLLRVQNRSQVGNRLDDNIHALSRGVGISALTCISSSPLRIKKSRLCSMWWGKLVVHCIFPVLSSLPSRLGCHCPCSFFHIVPCIARPSH